MIEEEGRVELWLARNTSYEAEEDDEQHKLRKIMCTLLPREIYVVPGSEGELLAADDCLLPPATEGVLRQKLQEGLHQDETKL